MIFYVDNKHKTNKFIIILDNKNKINNVSNELDYTIVKTNKMFKFKKKNKSDF